MVTTTRGHTTVIGGEDEGFSGVVTGQAGIYYGSYSAEGTYTYPSPTVQAWQSFIATATAKP